ncbi:MAG: hypothetical protein GC172_13065 [Phycisphaera sp.]|nr:hypothetical protein [Phycisphaera sp.]
MQRKNPLNLMAGGACAALVAACAWGAATAPAQNASDRAETPPKAEIPAFVAVQDRYLVRIAVEAALGSEPESTPAADDTPPGTGGATPAAAPDAPIARESLRGRLIVFLLPDEPRFAGIEPAAGPPLDHRAVVASIPIAAESAPGGELALVTGSSRGEAATAGLVSTHRLAELSGRWRAQAVLDIDRRTAGHLGAGNLASEVVTVDLAPDRFDEIRLDLTRQVRARAPVEPGSLADARGLALVRHPSALLRAHGRATATGDAARADTLAEDIEALVVFPYGYDDLAFPRRRWPTIYVIGDRPDAWEDAFELARIVPTPEARATMPQAVWVYLRTETPWGHAGFTDSETHGPRLRALVEEFIPHLEQRFRLIPSADARVVVGHGHGGWSAVDLAIEAPATFGAAFASAPSYLDLAALAGRDLYTDANLFTDGLGNETAAVRAILGPDDDLVRLTMREEFALEAALDPSGRSGLFWHELASMWSPFDLARRTPRALVDRETGEVDLVVAESWAARDVARRFLREPARVGPIIAERVRIVCGTRDDRARHLAAAGLAARVDAWLAAERRAGRQDLPMRSAIDLVEGLDDVSTRVHARLRFNREIADYLRTRGHAETPGVSGDGAAGAGGGRRPEPAPRPAPAR